MRNVMPAGYGARFDFSVVMAVYGTAAYLRKAVESLLSQDIGFREHVQLILVDDGSQDGAGDIADEYALRFPGNIAAIHKPHGGAASARNEGLKYVAGRYVNFLDSDDRLSSSTLRDVRDFFEAHGDEADLVAVPIQHIGGSAGGHWLNDKFRKGAR